MKRLIAISFSILNVLIPYGLFAVSLFFLVYLHIGLFIAYQVPDGFYVLAVFSMIFLNVGSAIISPLDIAINVIADIQTPSGPIEIVQYSGGNYSIGDRGSAGIGVIILKFIVNVLLSPFMIIFWLILLGLIIFKKGFADYYISKTEDNIKMIANIIMLIGFVLSAIEIGCVMSRSKEYSPDKFTFETSNIELVRRNYYINDIVCDTYNFEITMNHPHIEQLTSINGQEVILLFNKETINRFTLAMDIPDYYWKRNETLYHDRKLHCRLDNFYKESGHDGHGSAGGDIESFDGFIKLSEIDVSKIEIHYKVRDVAFGNEKYNYIRLEWKDIQVNNNFALN